MKTDAGAALDRPDVATLIGPAAALLDLTSEFSPRFAVPALHALHLRRGYAVVRRGCILPVTQGQTCTAAFLDPSLPARDAVLAPLSAPQGSITHALLLTGSLSPLDFIYHAFPALLFLKHISAPVIRVHFGQDAPPSLAPLIDGLAPLLSGGKPVLIERLADGAYEIEDCIFPIRATRPFFPASFARRVILPFVLKRAAPGATAPTRLFLRGSGQRTLVNEEQVAAWFGARGYEAIDTDGLPFAEQAVLISRASHIASVDGQALASLAVAVKAQTVIVLGGAGTTLEPPAAHLAEDYDATLIFVAGTPDPGATDPDDFTIALEHLEKIESSLL